MSRPILFSFVAILAVLATPWRCRTGGLKLKEAL
jgi:hypothetical protein